MRRSPTGALTAIAGTDGRTGLPFTHAGFIPNPLGEAPAIGQTAWLAVAEARDALARLDQTTQIAGASLMASWMSAPLLRREAQSTSALEGTFEPLDRVLAVDSAGEVPLSVSMREVRNYVVAADMAYDTAKSGRGLTAGEICALQGVLVSGTPAARRDPGQLRTTQVAVGGASSSIEDARFVPMPPGTALMAALESLVEWMRNEDGERRDPVVEAAMFHYQFETLHPFTDGNGRIGRLLIVAGLLRRGLLAEPLLTISPWLERNDREYRDRLYSVSAQGEWSGWIEFFAVAMCRSAEDVLARVERIQSIALEMKDAVSSERTGTATSRLPDLLVSMPIVSVASVTKGLGCSTPTADKAIQSFVRLGYLRETTGSNYGRQFAATQMVEVLMRPVD